MRLRMAEPIPSVDEHEPPTAGKVDAGSFGEFVKREYVFFHLYPPLAIVFDNLEETRSR